MLIMNKLSSLLIYFMSSLFQPRIVRLRHNQILRIFLWGGENLDRKPHLVKWVPVCLDKRHKAQASPSKLGAWK